MMLCISAAVMLTLYTSYSSAATTTLPKAALLVSSLLPWSRPAEKRTLVSEIWIPEDAYQGPTFFDTWDFFTQPDPTQGTVNYVNSSFAFSERLAMVTPDGQVVMRMDNTTWLPQNGLRNSVRISSQKRYNSGLFILDLNRAPWGCSVWPAFWTVGDNWPNNGEIDIFEGVHDNTHDQITWHTANGCNLTVPGNFTGTPSNHTNCGSSNSDNSGCAITDWSRASYGPQFDALNGGVYAMKWDQESIAIWFFYRASIPTDIVQHAPNPSGWGLPSAELVSSGCNLTNFFVDHQIVFDITTCGDWAGASFATSGCPGSCGQTVQDPNNFINASWIINSLHVYSKTSVTGTSRSRGIRADVSLATTTALLANLILMAWYFSL